MDSLNKYKFVFYKNNNPFQNNNPFLLSITIEEDCVVSAICRLCKDIFNTMEYEEEDFFRRCFDYMEKDEDLNMYELNEYLKEHNKPEIHQIFKNDEMNNIDKNKREH